MYKPSLMTALLLDYENSAKAYMEARDSNEDDAAELSERWLHRMKRIGCNIEYCQRLMEGTLGHHSVSGAYAHAAGAAMPARPLGG